MSIVDLMSDSHEWLEARISGAELAARMYPLHVDLQRGTRTVLLTYPDGWNRRASGTQPAGEEFVALSGGLTMSGHQAVPGEVLVVTPRALRAETSSQDGTRAIIFYSGPGGGWEEGSGLAEGTVTSVEIVPGVVRAATQGLVGRLEVLEELPVDGFEVDAEVVWLESFQYAFVPRGGLPPTVAGRVLVRFLA